MARPGPVSTPPAGAALALLCAAAPALAAEAPIPPEEWRALTLGKTVHYAVDGRDAGREYYREGGDFAVFLTPDGACVEGPWAYAGGRYCFWYGEAFQCFAHLRRGADIVSRPEGGGADQIVARIAENEPLSCDGD